VMQPVPPTESAGISQSLWPASAQNCEVEYAAESLVILAMPPHVSYGIVSILSRMGIVDVWTCLDAHNVVVLS
jgi:hypothetical protein